jgi:alkanesulfonate monooxygenase SsuD/methylene tetrahydromethanopterin reductase-like flavin-dependent oxidoreductase (luciferase family)
VRPPASLLRFNLASPDTGAVERGRLAATMRDLVAAADAAGLAEVTVSEHHVTRNRSLSSPIVAAATVLARSERVPVSISALLLPLYDPVRVALDLAALEEAFPERLRVVAALGYRPEEYALHGRDFASRGARLDAALETVLATWRAEPADGVAPVAPASAPERFLAVGGQSRAAARRAVRHGLPFAPRAHLPELRATYEDLCAAAGREPDCWMPAAHFAPVHVA